MSVPKKYLLNLSLLKTLLTCFITLVYDKLHYEKNKCSTPKNCILKSQGLKTVGILVILVQISDISQATSWLFQGILYEKRTWLILSGLKNLSGFQANRDFKMSGFQTFIVLTNFGLIAILKFRLKYLFLALLCKFRITV